MVLAGVLLKLGTYGLVRVRMVIRPVRQVSVGAVCALRLWGAVLAGLVCLRRTDMKALIAYRSVRHIALAFSGILTGTSLGAHGALVLRVAHGLASSGLFVLADANYQGTNRRRLLLRKGILALAPQVTLFWYVAALMNMATPPFFSFLAEVVLVAVIRQAMACFLLPVCVAAILSVAYSLHLVVRTQHGWPPLHLNPHHLFRHRMAMGFVAHVVPALAAGLVGERFFLGRL